MTDFATQQSLLSPIRSRMVQLARSYDGLDAGEDPQRYLALVAPFESAQMRHDMLGMSGCALFLRGLLRQLGVEHEALDAPYHLQHALDDLMTIAQGAHAWRVPHGDPEDVPELGDFVIVGAGGPDVHAFTVVGRERQMSGRWRLTTIDGGQHGPTGAQHVLEVTRDWTILPTVTWDHRIAPLPQTVRRVTGWGDLERIVELFGSAA